MTATSSSGCRILLIEDAEDSQQVFRAAMESSCEIEVAETGSEALAKLTEEDYDLVVLDLELPDCNGFTVLQMADVEPHEKKPFIIYSALSEVSDFVEKLDGFILVDYLAKPVEISELRFRVSEALVAAATRS